MDPMFCPAFWKQRLSSWSGHDSAKTDHHHRQEISSDQLPMQISNYIYALHCFTLTCAQCVRNVIHNATRLQCWVHYLFTWFISSYLIYLFVHYITPVYNHCFLSLFSHDLVFGSSSFLSTRLDALSAPSTWKVSANNRAWRSLAPENQPLYQYHQRTY